MPQILKNTLSGAFTEPLDENTEAFQALIQQLNGTRPLWEDASEVNAARSLLRVAVGVIDPLGAAVSDTFRADLGPLSEGGSITSAEYWPTAALVGAAVNSRTLTVVGQVAGTTHATLALVAGVNLVVGVGAAFTVNSAPVVGGEQLAVASASVGTGLPDPGGIVTVEFSLAA